MNLVERTVLFLSSVAFISGFAMCTFAYIEGNGLLMAVAIICTIGSAYTTIWVLRYSARHRR